jgi:glucan biosynthesis protein C
VFFLFGWLLFRARHTLDTLSGWCSLRPVLALVAVLVAWQAAIYVSGPDSRVPAFADRVAAAVVTWTLLRVALACFIRFAPHESRRMRYLSDASYWMYIVHLPVVIWTAAAMARVPAFALIKFAVVLTVTTLVCIGTYHAFVRRTFVGEFLNGRKFFA